MREGEKDRKRESEKKATIRPKLDKPDTRNSRKPCGYHDSCSHANLPSSLSSFIPATTLSNFRLRSYKTDCNLSSAVGKKIYFLFHLILSIFSSLYAKN